MAAGLGPAIKHDPGLVTLPVFGQVERVQLRFCGGFSLSSRKPPVNRSIAYINAMVANGGLNDEFGAPDQRVLADLGEMGLHDRPRRDTVYNRLLQQVEAIEADLETIRRQRNRILFGTYGFVDPPR